MGLFSSKTVITVSSETFKLIANPPETVKQSVIYALLNDQSLPDTVLDDAISGYASKAKQAFDYAYNDYVLGLPQGKMYGLNQVSNSTVQSIIETEIGESVYIIFSFIDDMTPEIMALEYLRSTRGYKISTNEITIHNFAVRNNKQPLQVYNVTYSNNTLTINYRQAYSLYNIKDRYTSFSETIPYNGSLLLNKRYCITAYQTYLLSGAIDPVEKYWIYDISNDTYPELSAESIEDSNETRFFPVVPLRRNNVNVMSDEQSELYITGKKLLDKLNLDITTLIDLIEENPSINQIDHAYVMFGVPIDTTVEASKYYLYKFFEYLGEVSIYNKDIYIQSTNTSIISKRNSFITKITAPADISLLEYGLQLEIIYDYITSNIITGNIGSIGTVETYIYKKSPTFIRLRIQLTNTTYKEIIVYNLAQRNVIQGHAVIATLSENSSELLIPISYDIANGLPLMLRNNLYYDSLRMVINSYDKQKIKWYQSGFFKLILVVVAIIISIYTGGMGGFIAGLSTAASGGVIAVIAYLLPGILIGIAINYGLKFVAKLTGAEIAMILGAIVYVIGISNIYKGSFNIFGSKLPTSQLLLQAGSAIINSANTFIATEIDEVMKDMEAFESEAEKKWDILEEAEKLLDTDLNINPVKLLTQVQPVNIVSESPDAFYKRTIHTPNIGVLTLDVIENYVNVMLKLPENNFI